MEDVCLNKGRFWQVRFLIDEYFGRITFSSGRDLRRYNLVKILDHILPGEHHNRSCARHSAEVDCPHVSPFHPSSHASACIRTVVSLKSSGFSKLTNPLLSEVPDLFLPDPVFQRFSHDG